MELYRPVCWAMAVAGVLGWAMLAFFGGATIPQWLATGVTLPTVLAPLPGAFLGAAVVALAVQRSVRPGGFSLGAAPGAVLLIAALTTMTLALAAAETNEVRALNAALVCVFGTLTLFVGAFAVEAIRRGDGVTLESHWGGLGGGLGGWRLSTGGVLVLLMLALAGATWTGAVLRPDVGAPANTSGSPRANSLTGGK